MQEEYYKKALIKGILYELFCTKYKPEGYDPTSMHYFTEMVDKVFKEIKSLTDESYENGHTAGYEEAVQDYYYNLADEAEQ